MTFEDEFAAVASRAEQMENLKPLIASVAAYRDECLAQGFSETVSECMAAEFHGIIMHMFSHRVHEELNHG